MEEKSFGAESDKEKEKSEEAAEMDTASGKILSIDSLRAMCEDISNGKEGFEQGTEKV